MVNNNELKITDKKFVVPTAPKTYEVRYIENKEPSKLSKLASWLGMKTVDNCSHSGCPLPASVPCRLDINIEGINRKWARRADGNGSWLSGYWEKGNFNSNQLSRWSLIVDDVDECLRVIPLLSNDSVYTINFWGTHCAEDAKFCNVSMDIIRKTIDSHERGNGIDENIMLDSDISKWTRWTVKTVAVAATATVNPIAAAGLGASSWMIGKGLEHRPGTDERERRFFGSVSNIGGDVFWSGAGGWASEKLVNTKGLCEDAYGNKITDGIREFTGSSAEAAAKHKYHQANGRYYDSDCPFCNA